MNLNRPDTSVSRLDWRTEFKRLDGAYAVSTIRSYLSDVRIYVEWCEVRGLVPFPAKVTELCAFLEDQAASVCPASVRRRVYSIRKAHRLLQLPDPTWDEEINITVRRVRRSKPNRPKQAKGMTRQYLEKCLETQPDTPWGLRNRAMMALGYDLLTRRSELIAIRTDEIEFRADGTLRVLIRRSKADPYGLGRIAFSSKRTAKLVSEWLDWRGAEVEPLFCGIYQGKPINRALGTTKVKLIIKEAAAAAGLSAEDVGAFSGHSLRVGAAQDLLCAGHDTAAIMRAGGWKSVNVLGRYLELAEHNVWA